MRYVLMIVLLLFVSVNAFAYCNDPAKCPSTEQKTGGKSPGLATGVGTTAASGILAAPFGATAALSSMAITGGFSLFSAALTNTDQKMFANFYNKAAKVIKKGKNELPCKDIKTGDYELKYGNCRDAPKEMKVVKADLLYSKIKETEPEDPTVSMWENIHTGENAFFVIEDDASSPLLAFYNNILLGYNENGKSVTCTGQIKPGTYNKDLLLYCIGANGKFCNKVYGFTQEK